MTFDEAVAHPGHTVQVSGRQVRDGKRVVMIYLLGDDGAKQLAFRQVPEEEHAALVASLSARGLAIADTELSCDFIWIIGADGVEVWDRKQRVLSASGERAIIADGTVVPRTDIARVVTYASDNYVHRGVKGELRSGAVVDLAVEVSLSTMSDPTYSRNELLMETGWASTLAVAIATWAGTSFEDRI